MTRKELNKILKNHEKWLNGKGEERANLIGADLSGANLSRADLSGANLSRADLSGADLSRADLSGADLSGAIGLVSTIDFMKMNFERTDEGYIAYKTFGSIYASPETWKIESGSIISENVNFNRTFECGSGINVASLKWVRKNYNGDIWDIWKVLIRWEWLCGVCVPYNTDGKIRCERVELIGKDVSND